MADRTRAPKIATCKKCGHKSSVRVEHKKDRLYTCWCKKCAAFVCSFEVPADSRREYRIVDVPNRYEQPERKQPTCARCDLQAWPRKVMTGYYCPRCGGPVEFDPKPAWKEPEKQN